jgi:hypothetical protein
MAVRPHVREVINDLVMKLTREAAALKISDGTINTSKPTWSEIVAGVKSSHVEVQHSNIHKISIVIITQVCKVPKFLNVVNNLEIRNQIRTINPVNQKKLKPSKETHNIILIGDSHARGCTGKLQENLRDQFEVLGYVKPGAGVSVLTETALKEVSSLTKKDFLIFWGSTNDIATSNSTRGMKQMHSYLIENQHTKILFVEVPCRHDLNYFSDTNEDISMFNRKLGKITNKYKHTTLVNLDLARECVMRHGLHIRNSGKDKIMKSITNM